MTILPKKKPNSKEKSDNDAGGYRHQRFSAVQRHTHGGSLSPDLSRLQYQGPNYRSFSGYNQNYLHGAGFGDVNLSNCPPESSQNNSSSWIGLNYAASSLEILPNMVHSSHNPNYGGVSKRKKKRDMFPGVSNNIVPALKPSTRNQRVDSTDQLSEQQQTVDCASNSEEVKGNTFPSPPHQNSEDEYDNLTEVSSQERELRFERQLKAKKGFLVKKMKEDGACLFRAISDQIYGDQDMHSIIRNLVCDYMLKNRDFFQHFVTEDFNKYIERKRVDSEHGNHVELQAISEMYNRPIEIYIYEAEPANVFQSSYGTDNPPIRLSYHNNMHYNSVVDPYAATVGVGLGLPSFTPGVAEKNLLKDAMRASESQFIEQAMYEDKLRLTDWEATSEAINEAVLRESRLQFMRDQEKEKQRMQSPPTTHPTNTTSSPRSSPGHSQCASSGFYLSSSSSASSSFADDPLSCFSPHAHPPSSRSSFSPPKSPPVVSSSSRAKSPALLPCSTVTTATSNQSDLVTCAAGVNGGSGKNSPDLSSFYLMWPPNSPKTHFSGDFESGANLSVGVPLGVAGSSNGHNPAPPEQQQQQPEYSLLRALMESQLDYYNSFKRRSPPAASTSPQPGPSSS